MDTITPLRCFSLLLLTLQASGLTWASESPNVILIVTDDQGYGDMSCHGNPWLETPNLDRLAQQGVSLDDYHVDPVCTPTRAALMTGRYSSRVGAWTVTQGRQLLAANETTIAEVFAASGYRTGMFGKWHLGDVWPYAPRFRGFQTVVRHLAGGIDEIGNPFGNDYFDDTYYRNGKPEKIDGYCTDVFFDECMGMISQPSDKPFFVYLPLNAMHSPHTVPESYAAPFRERGHSDARSKFFGQIVQFDQNLGRLLDFLDAQHLSDNTIVVFMGDNGTAQGSNGRSSDDGYNAGMRGKKGSVYEGGHRVACFVRWPPKLKAGQTVDRLTSCRDWLPTLIEWCGLQSPRELRFDGQSMADLLTEDAPDWPDRALFVERQGDQPVLTHAPSKRRRYPHHAVLTEDWRMVDGELYDIHSDPAQKTNVALEHPDVLADLKSDYENHFRDVHAVSSTYTRFQVGAAAENPTRLTVRDWHPTKGNVIWKQEHLGDDALLINGFWAIHVRRPGSYQIRLSRFPDDAPAAMRAREAKLKVGDLEVVRDVNPDDSDVTFQVELPVGDAILQTWLSDSETNAQRGSYFVTIHHK